MRCGVLRNEDSRIPLDSGVWARQASAGCFYDFHACLFQHIPFALHVGTGFQHLLCYPFPRSATPHQRVPFTICLRRIWIAFILPNSDVIRKDSSGLDFLKLTLHKLHKRRRRRTSRSWTTPTRFLVGGASGLRWLFFCRHSFMVLSGRGARARRSSRECSSARAGDVDAVMRSLDGHFRPELRP